MASNLYTVDISMNINTGCVVCQDETMTKTHGLCCDLVEALQSNFCKNFPLYNKRFSIQSTGDQKKLQDIVIKNVVAMLDYKKYSESNVDDTTQSYPISRYKFCQLHEDDLQTIAEITVSMAKNELTSLDVFQGEAGELTKQARKRQEAEMLDTLKLLQTRFNNRTTENNDKNKFV